MSTDAITGTRIRERRLVVGLKQADMARKVGISASYLNLIEHNRRRIGGKLLLDIAEVLDTDPQLLTDGAEAALIADLREVAEAGGLEASEQARADEFAGRFPGWAEVLAGTRQRVFELERTVDALNDRLAHDPYLADKMHELLSTAAAVRSTAAILAETKTLREEWRARFHANIDEDSRRLSDSAEALVSYLDVKGAVGGGPVSPTEEVTAFVSNTGYVFPQLHEEGVDDARIAQMVRAAPELVTPSARNIAVVLLTDALRDEVRVSIGDLTAQLERLGSNPIALAAALDVEVTCVLRSLARLVDLSATLMVTDRTGNPIWSKMAVPSSAVIDAEALWHPVVFAALGTPGLIAHQNHRLEGRTVALYAVAEPARAPRYNVAPDLTCTLLILPVDDAALTDAS